MVHKALPGKPSCEKCSSCDIEEDEFGISCLDCGYVKEVLKRIDQTSCPKCSMKADIISYRDARAIVCANCGFDERIEFETEHGAKSGTKSRGPYRAGGSARSQKKSF